MLNYDTHNVSTKEKYMKQGLISVDLAQKVLNYLGSRPYAEIHGANASLFNEMVSGLLAVQVLTDEQSKLLEAKEEIKEDAQAAE